MAIWGSRAGDTWKGLMYFMFVLVMAVLFVMQAPMTSVLHECTAWPTQLVNIIFSLLWAAIWVLHGMYRTQAGFTR